MHDDLLSDNAVPTALRAAVTNAMASADVFARSARRTAVRLKGRQSASENYSKSHPDAGFPDQHELTPL